MTKALIAKTLQDSAGLPGTVSARATNELLKAIVKQMKTSGKFTLPGFGSFKVHKTKKRKALNPKTLEPITVKAGRTVRFKASPVLKKSV